MQVTAPLLLLLLGFLFPICARSENRFRRPPGPGPAGDFRDNPVYRLGDRIDLQWDTDLDAVDVLVRQKQPNGVAKPAYAKLAVNSKAKSLIWTVGYTGFPSYHDPNLSSVYFLQFFRTGETEADATSHYFNISSPATTAQTAAASAATSGTGLATSLTLALGSATAAATAGPTTTTTSASTAAAGAASREKGLSSRAAAGVAVGATLGALAAAGLAGWAAWRCCRRRKAIAHTQVDIITYAGEQLNESGAARVSLPWKLELPVESHERFEVEALEVRHEMPAEPVAAGNKSTRSGSFMFSRRN